MESHKPGCCVGSWYLVKGSLVLLVLVLPSSRGVLPFGKGARQDQRSICDVGTRVRYLQSASICNRPAHISPCINCSSSKSIPISTASPWFSRDLQRSAHPPSPDLPVPRGPSGLPSSSHGNRCFKEGHMPPATATTPMLSRATSLGE